MNALSTMADCCNAECYYAERRYAECLYAECRGAITFTERAFRQMKLRVQLKL
jgi:hypothetical protein